MFEPWLHNGEVHGYALERGDRFYFFGTRRTRREDLPKLFPQYEFCFLKQVHGRAVVPADPKLIQEADAHFTDVRGRALVSQSADCLPVLLSSDTQVCAIHAGWRGMAQNIIGEAGRKISAVHFAGIGPHIAEKSFEVGSDVADQLLSAAPQPGNFVRPALVSGKAFFDLKALAHAQLAASFGQQLEIDECLKDTMTDSQFHSFRRDRERAERQYSFVVMNP